jgi:parallel beta-helix repeat protein
VDEMKKGIFIIGIIILLLNGLEVPLSNGLVNNNSNPLLSIGSTLYVGGNGSGNYSKIQDAIDNASDGDRIFVYSGFYYENVVLNKSITLIGEDREKTVIDGCGEFYVVHIISDNVTVENFYITNSTIYGTNSGIKIYGERKNITIYNNIIIDNFFGICVGDHYQYKRIYNVNITNNCIANNTYGIGLIEGQESLIFNNTFVNNGLLILSTAPKENIVKNNTINGLSIVYLEDKSNKIIQPDVGQVILVNCEDIEISFQTLDIISEVGIQLIRCEDCNVIKNQISNKEYGIYSIYSDYTNIQANIIENATRSIYLYKSDFQTISFNNINCSRDPMYLQESNQNKISYNILKNGKLGIDLWKSNKNIISNNNIYNFYDNGIDLFYDSSRNQILNNTVYNCSYAGIIVNGPGRFWWDTASIKNVLSRNNVRKNRFGIVIDGPTLTKVFGNNVINNYVGVEVRSARLNKIFKNNIFDNIDEDAILKNSFSSRFIGNFWNDTKRIHVIKGGIYRWDFFYTFYYEVIPLKRFDWNCATEPFDIGV